MNGIMKENVIVKEYEFDKPLIQKIDSIIDNCIRDCHHKYFHTFDHICEYDLYFPNNVNKIMGSYELNKKLTLARERGSKFNQINKLTIKIYCNISHINIHYHLRLGSPPLHRQFFMKISKNKEYIQTYCNDCRNPFQFACRQWFSYNNPGILT